MASASGVSLSRSHPAPTSTSFPTYAANVVNVFLHSPAITPYPLTLALSVFLGYHGYRSGSLAPNGALAAASFGYLTLANPLKVFGVALLGFYFVGSRATKFKADYKRTLEEEHAPTSSSSSPVPSAPNTQSKQKKVKAGGNRSAAQVACNALLGTLFAVAWRYLYSGEVQWDTSSELARENCAVSGGIAEANTSRALIWGAVAFWSACLGDTLASELGILSRSAPILVTTLQPVPRGTNGGISPWGILMSVVGGVFVGFISAITSFLENKECHWVEVSWLVVIGGWSGFLGSMIDSVLGATVQESLYSKKRSKIVQSWPTKKDDNADDSIEVISGRPILSNNGVNIISSTSVGLLFSFIGAYGV